MAAVGRIRASKARQRNVFRMDPSIGTARVAAVRFM
jgi:hypothetical protein